jgi:hypothetical protein
VVWSLELGPPVRVWYEGPPCNGETYPAWERIHYEFAGTRFTTGPITMIWHDGGKKPDASKIPLPLPEAKSELKRKRRENDAIPSNGSLYIGEKGTILCPHAGDMLPMLLPADQFADVQVETVESVDHYQQWANACKGDGKATSHFDYSGPLTETVLMGTVAHRLPGEKLEWDSAHLRFTNNENANQLLHKTYRKGWEVPGLTDFVLTG